MPKKPLKPEEIKKKILDYAKQAKNSGLTGIEIYSAILSSVVRGVADIGFSEELINEGIKSVAQVRFSIETAAKYIEKYADVTEITGLIFTEKQLKDERESLAKLTYENMSAEAFLGKEVGEMQAVLEGDVKKFDDLQKNAVKSLDKEVSADNFDHFYKTLTDIAEMEKGWASLKSNPEFAGAASKDSKKLYDDASLKIKNFCENYGISTIKDEKKGYSEYDQILAVVNAKDKDRAKVFFDTAALRKNVREISPSEEKENQFLKDLEGISDFNGTKEDLTVIASSVTTLKTQAATDARAKYTQGIKDNFREASRIINESIALYESGRLEEFYTSSNLSSFVRACSKYEAVFHSLKGSFDSEISGGFNNIKDFGKHHFGNDFPDDFLYSAKTPVTLLSYGKMADRLLDKVLENASASAILKINSEAENYVYPIDDEKEYRVTFAGVSEIKEKVDKSEILTEEEKQKFEETREFLLKDRTLEGGKSGPDEDILDALSTYEGDMAKKHVESMNLPFSPHMAHLSDFVIDSFESKSDYFAGEYVFDELEIKPSTVKDIFDVIKMAEDLGIMQDAVGGESGFKSYGFGQYFKAKGKVFNAIVDGKELTDPDEIAENAKEITELTDEYRKVQRNYETLMDFIGNKFGNSVSGNIYSNRSDLYPKEWRTPDRNRQMAQFNGICQMVFYAKTLNIPVEQVVEKPIRAIKDSIADFRKKHIDDVNKDRSSLAKRMANYLVQKSNRDYNAYAFRMIESVSKLEKDSETRVNNAIVGSVVPGYLTSKAAIDSTQFYGSPMGSSAYIRNIFLNGDKTDDFADLVPGGYNPVTNKFAEVNYKKDIKDKNTTPQMELDNLLKAVTEYEQAVVDEAFNTNKTTGEQYMKPEVSDYYHPNLFRYQAQQYFADFVVQKGYKKGSPEYKLLEDYINDPAKVENEYRKRNNLPELADSSLDEINAVNKRNQKDFGNRLYYYENPGIGIIAADEESIQKLEGYYKVKDQLTEKVFNGTATEKEEEDLLKANDGIKTVTGELAVNLENLYREGYVTKSYFDARMKQLESGDFSKKLEMFEKPLTKKEYIRQHSNSGLDEADITLAYNTYLEAKDIEVRVYLDHLDERHEYMQPNEIEYVKNQKTKINALADKRAALDKKDAEIQKALTEFEKSAEKLNPENLDDFKELRSRLAEIKALSAGFDSDPESSRYFRNYSESKLNAANKIFEDVLVNKLHLDSSLNNGISDVTKESEAATLDKLINEGLEEDAKLFMKAAHNRYWAEQSGKTEAANVSAQAMTTISIALEKLMSGEPIPENLARVEDAVKKVEDVSDVLREYYSEQLKNTLSSSMDLIHEANGYINSPDIKEREKFFAFANMSKYTRAYGKVFSAIESFNRDINQKAEGGYKNVGAFLEAKIPGFNGEFYGMSVNSKTMMSHFRTMDTVLDVICENATLPALAEMNKEAAEYIYKLDDSKRYSKTYGEKLSIISSKLESSELNEQEKKNFEDAVTFLHTRESFDADSVNADENILDAMADGDGIITKDYVDALNLPFNAYDKSLNDLVIVQSSKEARDFGTEYAYDEMWIDDETKKNIREIIKKADELGILEEAVGGESGGKSYGYTKYSKLDIELKSLLAAGEKLTDPAKISENLKKITEVSGELKEYKARYEELFDFIGDKLGEGVAGNIFSNRNPEFPKEWREEGKNRQMAQFNAICQINYFSKEMGISVDEFIDHPVTSYRRALQERGEKLLVSDHNNNADSLGKRMAGYLTSFDKYSIDFTIVSGRMLEAMAKLEKNPENKVHNTMVMTFGGGALGLYADKDPISNFTKFDKRTNAQRNIRNIFLMGDKTHNFADLAPDGFNLSDLKPVKSLNYNEEIRNKETTPRQELDNILKAVIDYGAELDRIIFEEDPETERLSIKDSVTDYLEMSDIRYQGQQYFVDYVIQKGFRKGSPEYKLLEDYMNNPAKVENEYRKRNNLPPVNEGIINAEIEISQDKAGNRFKDYTDPGHEFIEDEKIFNRQISAKYEEKAALDPADEEAIAKIDREIAEAVNGRMEMLDRALDNGELTESYYIARTEALRNNDFTNVPPMFEKVLTEKEYARLHRADGLSKAELSDAYATYLDMRQSERQAFIEARDERIGYLRTKLTPYQKEQREKLADLSEKLKTAEISEKEIRAEFEGFDKLAEKAASGNSIDLQNYVKAFDRIEKGVNSISADIRNRYFSDFVKDTTRKANNSATNLTRDKFHLASDIEVDNLFSLVRSGRADQAQAYIEASKLRNSALTVGDNDTASVCAQFMITAIDNREWERRKDTIKNDFEAVRKDIKEKYIKEIISDIQYEKDNLDRLYARYADKSKFYTNETAYKIAKSFDKIDQFVSDYDVANRFSKISDEGSKEYGDLLKKELPDCEFSTLLFNKKNPEKNMRLLEVIVPASEVILKHMNFESVERCHGKIKNWQFCIENPAEYKAVAEKEIASLKENSYRIPLTKEERAKLGDSLEYLEDNLITASEKVTNIDENYVNEEVTIKEADLVKNEIKDDESFPHEAVANGADFLFKGLLPDAEAVTPYFDQDIIIGADTAEDIISVIEKAESLGILDPNSAGEQIRKGYGFSRYLESFNKARMAVEKDAKLTDKAKKAENAREIIKAAEEFKEINNKYDELIEFIGDKFDDSIPANIFTNREKEFPQKYRGELSKQCAQFNAISQIYSCCKANGIDVREFLKNPVKTAYAKSVEAKENYARNVLHSDTPEIGKRMAYFLTDHNALLSRKDFDKTTMRFGMESDALMRSLEAMCKLDPDNKVNNTIISAAARLIPNISGYQVNNIFGTYTIGGKQYDSSKYIRNFFAADPDELTDLGNASPYYYNISDKTAHTIEYAAEIKNNPNTAEQEINKVMGIISDYADEIDKAVKEAKDMNVYGGNVKTGDILFQAHEYMVDYIIQREIKPGSEEYAKIMDFMNNPIESINDFRKQSGRPVLGAQVKKEYKEALDKNPSRISFVDGTLEESEREINKQLRAFAERKAELTHLIEENPDNNDAKAEIETINLAIKGVTDQRIADLKEMGMPESYIEIKEKVYEVADFRDIPFSFDDFMKQGHIKDELSDLENDKPAYDKAAKEAYSKFLDEYYSIYYHEIANGDAEKNYMMGEALAEKQRENREKNLNAYNKTVDARENEKQANEFLRQAGELADFDNAVTTVKDMYEGLDSVSDLSIAILVSDIAKGNVKLSGIEAGDIRDKKEYDRIYGNVIDVLKDAGLLSKDQVKDLIKETDFNTDKITDIYETAMSLYDPQFASDNIVLKSFSDEIKLKIDVLAPYKKDISEVNTVGSHSILAAAQVVDEFAGLSGKERQDLMIKKVAQMTVGQGYYPEQPTEGMDIYSEDEKIAIYGEFMEDLLNFTQNVNKIELHVSGPLDSFGANLRSQDFHLDGEAYEKTKKLVDAMKRGLQVDNLDNLDAILRAKDAEIIDQRNREQRAIYDSTVQFMLMDEDDMPTLDDAIKDNAHIFGGDPQYAPFETAAKKFSKSLKDDREHFDEKAFGDMVKEAKAFVRAKNQKIRTGIREREYKEYIEENSPFEKIRLTRAKANGTDNLNAEKAAIEQEHLDKKAEIDNRGIMLDELEAGVYNYLSTTERERYIFADMVLTIDEKTFARGLGNLVEGEIKEYEGSEYDPAFDKQADKNIEDLEIINAYKKMDGISDDSINNNLDEDFKLDKDFEDELNINSEKEDSKEEDMFKEGLDNIMEEFEKEDKKDIGKKQQDLNASLKELFEGGAGKGKNKDNIQPAKQPDKVKSQDNPNKKP